MAGGAGGRGRSVCVGCREHVHSGAALLHRLARPGPADRADRRGSMPGDGRRLGDHRPHLTGRGDQGGYAGGALPAGSGHQAGRLQQLRVAARERSRHDPRNVCQHPVAKPARSGHGGGRDRASAERQAHEHLRRGHALQAGRHAARRAGGQGIRDGVVARLGGQGHVSARRTRGHRPELRADSSEQPGGDGRAPARVRRRAEP